MCPLFWCLNPPKEGPFQAKQGSFRFQVYIYILIFCMYVCLVPECMKIQLTFVLTSSISCVDHIDYSHLCVHLNHVKSKLHKCVYVCEYCVNMDVSDTQGNLTQVTYL